MIKSSKESALKSRGVKTIWDGKQAQRMARRWFLDWSVLWIHILSRFSIYLNLEHLIWSSPSGVKFLTGGRGQRVWTRALSWPGGQHIETLYPTWAEQFVQNSAEIKVQSGGVELWTQRCRVNEACRRQQNGFMGRWPAIMEPTCCSFD